MNIEIINRLADNSRSICAIVVRIIVNSTWSSATTVDNAAATEQYDEQYECDYQINPPGQRTFYAMLVFGYEEFLAFTVVWHLADTVLATTRFTLGHTLMSVLIPYVTFMAVTLFGLRAETVGATSFCTHWLASLIDLLVAGVTLTGIGFGTRTVRRACLRTDWRTEAILQLVSFSALTYIGLWAEFVFVTIVCTHWLANSLELRVTTVTLTFATFDAETVRRTPWGTNRRTGAVLHLVVIDTVACIGFYTFLINRTCFIANRLALFVVSHVTIFALTEIVRQTLGILDAHWVTLDDGATILLLFRPLVASLAGRKMSVIQLFWKCK